MAAKTSKNNPKDAYEVPEGVQKFTPEAKRDVVRDMLNHGGFNRQQIASLVGVSINVVTGVETQLSGKGKRIDQILAEKRAAAPPVPKTETVTLDGEKVVIQDIDAKAQQRGPEPTEAKVVRLESALNDMRGEVSGINQTVNDGFAELRGLLAAREAPPERPSAGNNGHGQIQQQPAGDVALKGQFDAIVYKIPVSSRQVALFEMWRAKQNKMARADPEHYVAFEGDIGDLVTQLAIPEFFKLRGATLVYREQELTAELRY